MVAHVAPTPAPRATGCLPTSAPSLASAPSSTDSPSASSASSSSTLSLSHSVTESLLVALAEPTASLASVAQAHNISIADLALWLTTPQARDRMLLIESGACTHTRMAASLNLTKAAAALIRVLDNYRALADSLAPTDPILLRASTRATKAAYHLYRLSRIVPVDPDLLATLPRPPARTRPQVSPPAHQQAHQQTRATPTDTALAHELIRAFNATAQSPTPAAASSQLPTPLPSSPLPSSPSSALSSPRSSASSAFNSSPRPSRSSRSTSNSSPSPRHADLIRAAAGKPLGSSP